MERDLDRLLDALDTLWYDFNNCRAHFPYIPENAVGIKSADTAPYYVAQGLRISFVFSEGLSNDGLLKINRIGHWINQNFVIRLCALLESYHILSNTVAIDFDMDGAEQVNIARRLRNCFAHSSGRYNPEDKDHVKTMELIRDHIGVPLGDRAEWPISIDAVLKPLYEGCKSYSKQKMESA